MSAERNTQVRNYFLINKKLNATKCLRRTNLVSTVSGSPGRSEGTKGMRAEKFTKPSKVLFFIDFYPFLVP